MSEEGLLRSRFASQTSPHERIKKSLRAHRKCEVKESPGEVAFAVNPSFKSMLKSTLINHFKSFSR